MKYLSLILLSIISISCKAQIYSIKSHVPTPEGAYLKDIDNDLPDYEGTWTGTWNNKIFYITFNKLTHQYVSSLNQYYDFLVGRFKVTDLNGNILFNNNLPNEKIKIEGIRFRKLDNRYLLFYNDIDMCNRTGDIVINFIDSTRTKLHWNYSQDENFIEPNCFYYGSAPADVPQPLPNDIILTKQ